MRRELGELLLCMSRSELLRAGSGDPAALRSAVEWNRVAEACFPPDQRPKWLARQRAELLGTVRGGAESLPETLHSDVDAYHEGLQAALAGHHVEALEKLIPFTNRHPNHFLAWFVRGVSHDGIGQMVDAAAAFTVCAAIRPEMPWPYFDRGLVHLQQKRYPLAVEDFTVALRLNPNWTNALLNRAIARHGCGDLAGAETDLTAALDRPDVPTRVYFIRSRVRRAAGDIAGAERDAAEAFKLTPADSVSWVTRGVWRLPTHPKEALADFEQALKENPRSRDALQNKAVVLADYLKQPKEAAAVMDRLLELYPAHIEATAGRGVYLARAGDGKGARRDAADCLRDEPTAFRYYQMAGLFAQLSRHEADGKARQEAFRLLALAFRHGFGDLNLMEKDRDIDPIRESDEFRSLVAHARALQPAR
jgi:tetratricopeptide (TPR) repeat protein